MNFCPNTFEDDLNFIKGYEVHARYFRQIYKNAQDSSDGNTGAVKEELVAAREFVWDSWARIKNQFECARANTPADKLDRVENNFEKLRKELVLPTAQHSLRCYFRMFLKRTTWKKVIKPEQIN